MAAHKLPRTPRSASPVRALAGRSIGIVGAGQVGGSLIQCLARHRPGITVLATDRDATLEARVRRHAGWRSSLASLVAASDIVVLAVPAHTILRLLPEVARHAARRASRRRLLVVDTGTIKAPVVATAARCAHAFSFVGLHPTVGVERNGWDAARPDMFLGQTVIYCPAGRTPDAMARELIRLIGARPVPMDAAIHDRLVAEGIGLPHIVAFAAAGAIAGVPAHRLRAGSWASLTRVVVSDAAMVAGFLAGNAANQLAILRRFQARLVEVERLLRSRSVRRLQQRLGQWQNATAGGSRRA